MLKNTRGAINPLAASESLASAAVVIPNKPKPFPLMLGGQAPVLAQALSFLSARDATAISLSSPTLNGVVKSPSFNALWLRHIQRDCPGLVTQKPSQQAYYRLYQDQALSFLLLPSHKIKDYDYSPIEQAANDFKNSTLKQRADHLTQWNKNLGLHQLENANLKNIGLQGLTELTPEVMQRLIEINQKTPIKRLRISGCYLPQLPEVLINFLKDCTQLQGLRLHDNKLQSLPETLLQFCTEVEELNLGSNQLQSLPEALLKFCTRLKKLDLSNNQLQSLPEALLKFCTRLKWLGLDNNQLQSLPEALLKFCTEVEDLNLGYNQLQSLPETLLKFCTQLTWLVLSDNQLQSLPETLLETCIQLEGLYLHSNHLMDITQDDFSHLPVSYLDIDSQTPFAASSSSTPSSSDSSSEEKTADNEEEDQPAQKKMRLKR